MKKVYCDLHMFEANQQVFIMDTDTNEIEYVTSVTMEELPEIVCAISNSKGLDEVLLTGNSIYGSAVAEDIVAYSKMNYNEKNIKVEVLKK